jgi:hypothetical protein
MKRKLSVTVDSEYIALIDSTRHLAGRSAVVNDILRREFANCICHAEKRVN